MRHEVHTFIACPTCRFVVRVEEEVPPRPCPECGWTLMNVDLTFWGEGNCRVDIGWNDDDGPMLDLPDARQVLRHVEELLDRECEEGLIPEGPDPTPEDEARFEKRSKLHEMRMARREREQV